jgi:hypothetical protein
MPRPNVPALIDRIGAGVAIARNRQTLQIRSYAPESDGSRTSRTGFTSHDVSSVVLDDHLLRDVLAGEQRRLLSRLVTSDELATTNLYYVRLCKNVVGAARWSSHWGWVRRAATRTRTPPIGSARFDCDPTDAPHRLPSGRVGTRHASFDSGAEAVAAAELLNASLCVWEGDDGPSIRSAARAAGVTYRTLSL